jgi:NADPH2:quinone reductase
LQFPLVDTPSTVKLTVYNSETITSANSTKVLEHVVEGIANGRYSVNLDRIFRFEEIVEAHRYMEENKAKGKLVVKIE